MARALSPVLEPKFPKIRSNTSAIERLNDLTNRGLGHTRAAQALQREILRQQVQNLKLETANAPLANDGFDPDQLRDDEGKWTNENLGASSGTNAATKTTTNPVNVTSHTPEGSSAKHLPPDPPVMPPAGISDEDWNCAGLAFRDYRLHLLDDIKQRLSKFRKLDSCSEKCKGGEGKFWVWQFDSEYSFYVESNGKRTLLPPGSISGLDTKTRLL